MSGWLTNGLVAPTSTNAGLPWASTEVVPVDTGKSAGIYPETVGASLQQLSYTRGTVQALPLSSTTGTVAVDCSTGNDFSVTIQGTNSTVTMSNPSPGQQVRLYIVQGTGGSATIGTWTNVLWAGGSAPTLTTTATNTDVVELRYNGTLGKWVGTSILNVK